jgi:uncharacterized protein
MTVSDISIQGRLRQLYEIQAIDSKVDEIQVLKGELPIEVSDLEDEIEGLQTRINKMTVSIQELESDLGKNTAGIKESEALILRYTKQLDEVKNNREYDALNKELNLQKLDIQIYEKKIREITTLVAQRKEILSTAQEKIDLKAVDLKNKKIELEGIIAKTEKEEKELKSQSDKLRKVADERLLKSYDRIRKTYRNGLAVVKVERDACGGCFNKIPPQTQLEISQRKKIIACEHCGRILVDNNIMVTED